MIIQNVGRDKGETDVTFTVPAGDLARSLDILESQKGEIGFNGNISDRQVAKISVFGVGMTSHAGIPAGVFKLLADRATNHLAISHSELNVSALIDASETDVPVLV